MGKTILRLFVVLAFALTLAACKSQEERAEEYYQSGLSLLEAGDADRAIVEFQNVFQLNENHKDARITYAKILLDRKLNRQAYGQLLRVAEQNPEEIVPRVELAQMAFQLRNWDEFQRHGNAAIEIAPDLMSVKAIALGLRYQDAVLSEDLSELEVLSEQVQLLLPDLRDNRILRNILIDSRVRASNIDGALVHLDYLIGLHPDEKPLQDQRLALIAQTQDPTRIENQLLSMIENFPDENGPKASLLRLYIAENEQEKAENFLRSISDPASEDPGPFLDLIRFVTEFKGTEAARIEIERGIAESPDPVPFRSLRAGLNFSEGNFEEAISELEEIVSSDVPSEHTNSVKVALARMLLSRENEVGARRLIEEVIVSDPLNTEALKMQAVWQIDADDTDGAIASLRTAIDASPQDVKAAELLAQAYMRAGSPELAREYLALAVDSSGNAPEQSLRYARALIADDRYLPAEDVLIPALRLAPGNTQLLAELGQLYLLMDDQPRTTQVIDTLKRIDTNETRQIANALRAEQLQREGGVENAVRFLEGVASESQGNLNAQMLLLRGRLANGDAAGALALIESMVAENPTDEQLPFALAAVKGATGDLEGAASDYRRLLSGDANRPRVWLELSRVLLRMGDETAANEAIEEGLSQNADDPNLLWARASVLEQDNQIDAAIAIYEDLYEKSSNSIIVANNLASLLSARRDDQESLDRAFVVARRFKDTETPALQDTYGWILHRKGQSAEALPYLESAASSLTNDALTQYHLGMVYVSLDQRENAIRQLQKTIDIAGPADTRPQIENARSELSKLISETE